jgi:hypothetical protein
MAQKEKQMAGVPTNQPIASSTPTVSLFIDNNNSEVKVIYKSTSFTDNSCTTQIEENKKRKIPKTKV